MKQQRSILYLGTDEEFLKELKGYCSKIEDINVHNVAFSKGDIASLLMNTPAHIIYVDFTSHDIDVPRLIQELIPLKKVRPIKGTLFAGLFTDEQHLADNSLVFSSGLQLSFIKGCESETLFRDSFYIGFNDKVTFPLFAKARKIYKELEVGICSSVTCLSPSELIIETDIDSIEGGLKFNLPFFPDLQNSIFKIKDKNPSPLMYPMTVSYILEYPYADAWDSNPASGFNKDTVETWLEMNTDKMDPRGRFIKIVSKNTMLISEIRKSNTDDFFIDFNENMPEGFLFDFKVRRTGLIFFDIDDEAEGKNSFPVLDEILRAIKSIESYYPVVMVSNSPSTGSALQALFKYQFITSMSNKLDGKTLGLLVESFIKRKTLKDEVKERYFFQASDSRRIVDVLYKFSITSLTEHEVTFLSDIEIPMFSVIHFKGPGNFYATLVPSLVQLEGRPNKFHYMAFIHGLNENSLKKLRQFVYQIINMPLKDFEEDTIKAVMRLISLDTKKSTKEVVLELAAPAHAEKEEEKEFEQIRDFEIKGKSKL